MSSSGIDFVINGDDNVSPVLAAIDSAVAKLGKSMQQMTKNANAEKKFEDGLRRQIKAFDDAAAAEKKFEAGLAKQIAAYDKVQAKTKQHSAALAAHKDSTKQAERGTKKLTSATNKLMAALGPLLALVAVVKTAMAAVGGVKAASAAFDEQTRSVKLLNSALEIRGMQGASAQMQAFSKQMEAVTGVAATQINALQKQALALGVATDRVDDATKAALGLSEATGKTASESMSDLTAALQGNFGAFEGLNPQIKFMRSEQEKLNAVMKIANQGLGMYGTSVTTVSGSQTRANTAMQTFKETLGKVMEPMRILVNAGLQQLWTSLQKLLAPAAERAAKMMEKIGPIMEGVQRIVVRAVNAIVAAFNFYRSVVDAVLEWMKPAIKNAIGFAIKAFVALEVYLSNLPTVWEMVKTATELALINISENFSYYLNEVIPQYLKWFSDNLPNFFNDAFANAITVVKNAGQIIAESVMGYLVIALNAGEWFAGNFQSYMLDAFNGSVAIVKNGSKQIADMVLDVLTFAATGGLGGIDGFHKKLGEATAGSLLEGFTASAKKGETDFAAEFDTIGQNAGRGLMDGFQNTVGNLPNIVGRKLTAKEQDLVDKLKAMGGKLGDEFAKKLEERILGVGDLLNAEMTASAKSMDLLARPTAVMQGVQSSESRLLTRGPASTMQQRMLETMNKIQQSSSRTSASNDDIKEQAKLNKEATDQVAANTENTMMLVTIT